MAWQLFRLGRWAFVKTIGFALAVGVLADAFLVRMTIVPAVMFILGERICGCRAGSTGSSPTSTSRVNASSSDSRSSRPNSQRGDDPLAGA